MPIACGAMGERVQHYVGTARPLGALRELNLIEQGTERPPRLTDQGWQYLRHGPVAPGPPPAGPKR